MIYINPGTEAIDGTTLSDATANIKHLISDIDSPHRIDYIYRSQNSYEDGRYAFVLLDYDNHTFHEIQMPGLPLSKVRYMQEEGQNIWDFPRLYIDDSSWIWSIAVGILREEFARKETEL